MLNQFWTIWPNYRAHKFGDTINFSNFSVSQKYDKFIIVTEPGVIHQMEKENPHKEYIPLANSEGCACNECPYMRLNTIDKMIEALKNLSPQIELSPKLIEKAKKPLIKMLELS